MTDPKTDLHEYLRDAREAVLREWGHFGAAFGRPFAQRLPWVDEGAEPNADLWATPEESREGIVDLYRRIAAHSDGVIADLPLDAVGHVPWWPPEHSAVTPHRILVHTIAEAHRYAGHADIVRELIDGSAGLAGDGHMVAGDPAWRERCRNRLERVARDAR